MISARNDKAPDQASRAAKPSAPLNAYAPAAVLARLHGRAGAVRAPRLLLFLMVSFWSVAVLIPVASLLFWSFMRLERFRLVWPLGLDAYRQVLETGRYGVILTTLRIAATVTVVELVISIPIALWLAKGVRS